MPRRGKQVGRRPLIADATIRERIADSISAGVPLHHSAALAGVPYRTLALWLANGRDAREREATGQPPGPNDALYLQFLHEAEVARAKAVALSVTHVQKASRGGYIKSERTYVNEDGRTVTERTYAEPEWRAATWLLERVDRSAFGKAAYVTLESVGEHFGIGLDGGATAAGAGRTVHDADSVVEALSARLIEARAARESAGEDESWPMDAEIVGEDEDE